MRRFAFIILAFAAFSLMPAMGQNEVVLEREYSAFKGVEVSGDFELSFVRSDSYSVRLTVDVLLEEYIQAYLKDGFLHIGVDSKSFSTELKKALRGRDAIVPVLKAEVSAPQISEIYLSDNVRIDSESTLESPSVSIVMSGRSEISSFAVKSEVVSLALSKSAKAVMGLEADSLDISASGASTMDISFKAGKVNLYSTGLSEVVLKGDASEVALKSDSSSRVKAEGKSDSLFLQSSGTTRSDVDSLYVSNAEISLSGNSKAMVNASEKLKVNLTGGSLEFDGNPTVEVVRIVSASMTRKGDTEVKKGIF